MNFLRWLLGRGISKTWELPSFHENPDYKPKVDRKTQATVDRLKKLCDKLVTELEPKKDYAGQIIETYCNVCVDRLASNVWGFTGFKGMVANGMFHRMKNAPDFAEVDPQAAQNLANDGRMVIAAITDDPHGHVAMCVPGKALYSGNWRCNAPLICNVGTRNGVMGANFAFREVPTFFAWIEGAVKEKSNA